MDLVVVQDSMPTEEDILDTHSQQEYAYTSPIWDTPGDRKAELLSRTGFILRTVRRHCACPAGKCHSGSSSVFRILGTWLRIGDPKETFGTLVWKTETRFEAYFEEFPNHLIGRNAKALAMNELCVLTTTVNWWTMAMPPAARRLLITYNLHIW